MFRRAPFNRRLKIEEWSDRDEAGQRKYRHGFVSVTAGSQAVREIARRQGTGRVVLLAPEQVLTPNAVALEVLKLCDGERSVEEIAALLSERYDADQSDIANDILPVLQNLADNGLLTL